MASNDRNALLAMMERHGISFLHYEDDSETIALSFAASSGPVLTSPAIGLFSKSHPMSSSDKKPVSRVQKDDIIGYLKIGPLLRPVIADADCHKLEAKVGDGTLVGYADALYDTH